MRHIHHSAMAIFAFLSLAALVFAPLLHDLQLITTDQVAAVTSAGASVAPNPMNTLYAQLEDRSKQLDAREQQLNAKAAALKLEQDRAATHDHSVLLYSLAAMILFFVLLQRYVAHRERTAHTNQPLGSPAPRSLFLPKTRYVTDLHHMQGHRS